MKTLSNVGARVGLRQRYNAERPHEALGQRLPASLYQPSPRPYPTTLLPITYPGHYEVRRVSRNGGIRWGSRWVNVSHVLAELNVGFEEIDDGLWEVYFGPVWLGRLQETTCRIVGGQWRDQSSAYRFHHKRADPCLFGGSQLLQREGDG
ncbi:MAG: hypothetical protein DMD41_16245, partial [Gemmatimonadetes bacterium]